MNYNVFEILKSHDENSTAIISKNNKINYKTFIKNVLIFENDFLKYGIKPDQKIAILCGNNHNFIYSIFALWKIGAVPIPLNTKLTDSELNYQINFIQSEFLITENSFSERNLKIKKKFFIDEIEINLSELIFDSSFKNNFDKDKIALMLFTSGTTEKPKAVMLTFQNLISSALNAINFLELNSQDKFLASLPFYHIGGFSIFMRAFICCGSVIIPNEISTNNIIDKIKNSEITIVSLVPTVLKYITDNRIFSPRNLRYILLGGAQTNSDLVKSALKLNYNIVKVYGSTETSAFVTALKVNDNIDKIDSIGKPLPGIEVKIFSIDNDEFQNSNTGEIAVKSQNVMKGYFNSDLNKFKDGFYLTGDIGFIDNEGFLFIESRRNDLIISGGENINPFEIENLLYDIDFIDQVCVFGISDEKWGEVPAAAIVLNKINLNDLEILKENILNFLKGKISSYKIPKKILFVEELPKTSLGKLKRNEIKRTFNQSSSL